MNPFAKWTVPLVVTTSGSSVAPGYFTVHDLYVPEYTMESDMSAATFTIEVIVPAPLDRAYALWADPRVLEKWWGPPGYPCSVETFELQPGGAVAYAMTGPDGQRYPGWWKVLEVEPFKMIRLQDGFGELQDADNTDMPVSTTAVYFEEREAVTVMTIHSLYSSPEDLQKALDLDMWNGFGAALSQIDELLAD